MAARKIRLWDKQNNKMIYPDDATNSRELIAVGLHGLPVVVDQDSFKEGEITGWNVDHRYERIDSTSLKDRQDKEIYDGDILGNEWGKYLIFWDRGGFIIRTEDGIRLNLGNFECKAVEIVGNIHENPELFKEE